MKYKKSQLEFHFILIYFNIKITSTASNFGSNHHPCIFQGHKLFSKWVPYHTYSRLNSRFIIRTVKVTTQTIMKPPSTFKFNCASFTPDVIVLIVRGKFHPIVLGKAIPWKKIKAIRNISVWRKNWELKETGWSTK